jgi:hypothetical protein
MWGTVICDMIFFGSLVITVLVRLIYVPGTSKISFYSVSQVFR